MQCCSLLYFHHQSHPQLGIAYTFGLYYTNGQDPAHQSKTQLLPSPLPPIRKLTKPGSAGSAGTAAESRLLLFVRNELPGRVAVQDDLDNTELPFFTLGKAWRRDSRGPGSP